MHTPFVGTGGGVCWAVTFRSIAPAATGVLGMSLVSAIVSPVSAPLVECWWAINAVESYVSQNIPLCCWRSLHSTVASTTSHVRCNTMRYDGQLSRADQDMRIAIANDFTRPHEKRCFYIKKDLSKRHSRRNDVPLLGLHRRASATIVQPCRRDSHMQLHCMLSYVYI